MNVLFDRLTRAEEEQLEAENKLAQAKARLEELQGLLLLDVLPTADEDTVESGGYTPLFFAVYKRRYEVLKLLLRAGADISARSQPATRLTALCQTSMLKTTTDTRSIFRTLLGCTPDSTPVCGVGVFRQEPRNAATNEQRKELIGQWLEQWKRNIDLRGSTVRPADIAEYAKIKAVYAKIKAGRNKCIERPKILVEEHWVPQVDHWLQQFHVRDWGLLEFRQLVARHCYPRLHPDPPVLAGRYGMPRWVVGMISDEYGINEPEANGVTPLMAAVRNRALPLVEDLIRLGALPNLTRIDHDTVLHIAVNAVWVDCTRTLCTQGTQLFEWARAWAAPVIEGRKRGFERAAFPKYADLYIDMWVRGGKDAIPSECAEALNNRNLIQIFEQHMTGPQAAGQGSRPPGAQLCAPGALDNSIPDKWTCPICTSLLRQPAKLPCGHVFCLRCITKAIGNIARLDKSLSSLICPFLCEQRLVQLPWLDEDRHRLLSTGEWWSPQKLTPEEEAEEGRRLDTGARYYRKHITERLSQRAADCLREFKPIRRDPTEGTVPDLMLNESGRRLVEIHGKRVQYARVQDVLHVTSVVLTGKEVEQVQKPCDWVRLARLYLFVLEGNYRGRSACSGSVTLNDLNELVMHLHIQLDLAFRSAAKECTTLICGATEPYRTTLMQLMGREEGTRPVVPTEIPNPENLAEVRGNMFKVRLMFNCLQHMLLEAPAHGGDADMGCENKEWYCRTASPTDGQWVCEAEGEHPVHLEYDEATDVIRVTTTVLEQFPHRVDVQGRLFGMLLRGNVQPEGGPPRGVEYIEQSLPGLSPAIHDGSVILQMAVQVGASLHTKLRDSFRDYVKFAGALRDKSNQIINQIQPPQSPEATSISTTERQLQYQTLIDRRILNGGSSPAPPGAAEPARASTVTILEEWDSMKLEKEERRAREELRQESRRALHSEVEELFTRPIYSGRLAPSLPRKPAPGTDGSLLSQREYTQDVLEDLCRTLSADLTEVPVRAASEEIAPTDTPTLLSKQYLQELFDHVKRAKSAEEQTAIATGMAKSCNGSPAALTTLVSPDETQTRQQRGHYLAVWNRMHIARSWGDGEALAAAGLRSGEQLTVHKLESEGRIVQRNAPHSSAERERPYPRALDIVIADLPNRNGVYTLKTGDYKGPPRYCKERGAGSELSLGADGEWSFSGGLCWIGSIGAQGRPPQRVKQWYDRVCKMKSSVSISERCSPPLLRPQTPISTHYAASPAEPWIPEGQEEEEDAATDRVGSSQGVASQDLELTGGDLADPTLKKRCKDKLQEAMSKPVDVAVQTAYDHDTPDLPGSAQWRRRSAVYNQKVHNGQFACPEAGCGRIFRKEAHMLSHRRKRHGAVEPPARREDVGTAAACVSPQAASPSREQKEAERRQGDGDFLESIIPQKEQQRHREEAARGKRDAQLQKEREHEAATRIQSAQRCRGARQELERRRQAALVREDQHRLAEREVERRGCAEQAEEAARGSLTRGHATSSRRVAEQDAKASCALFFAEQRKARGRAMELFYTEEAQGRRMADTAEQSARAVLVQVGLAAAPATEQVDRARPEQLTAGLASDTGGAQGQKQGDSGKVRVVPVAANDERVVLRVLTSGAALRPTDLQAVLIQ